MTKESLFHICFIILFLLYSLMQHRVMLIFVKLWEVRNTVFVLIVELPNLILTCHFLIVKRLCLPCVCITQFFPAWLNLSSSVVAYQHFSFLCLLSVIQISSVLSSSIKSNAFLLHFSKICGMLNFLLLEATKELLKNN